MKYQAMFWALLVGIAAGIAILGSIGFISTIIKGAVAVTVTGFVVFITLIIGFIGYVLQKNSAGGVFAGCALVSFCAVIFGSVSATLLALIAFLIAGMGIYILLRQFGAVKNAIFSTLWLSFVAIVVCGTIPALMMTSHELISKDQTIANNLVIEGDSVLTLSWDEQPYLKQFFYLKLNEEIIPFSSGLFEYKQTKQIFRADEKKPQCETKEVLKISFGKNLPHPLLIITKHPFCPDLEFAVKHKK